ncbi:hypothetical protein N9R80_01480 [bacterium]|nr:hypothetical protein [bacterium]
MSAPLDRQLAYLRLTRTDQIGSVTFQRLLNGYGSPEKAPAALRGLSQRGGRKRAGKLGSFSAIGIGTGRSPDPRAGSQNQPDLTHIKNP